MIRVPVRHDDLSKRLPDGVERGRDRVQVCGAPDSGVDERWLLSGEQPRVIAGPGQRPGISGIQVHQPG